MESSFLQADYTATNGTTVVLDDGADAGDNVEIVEYGLGDSNLSTFSNTFTLPGSDGSNGQALTTNGSGTLSFTTISGGGGSSLTVQDEGSSLSTAATTLNFVGSGVTASGTGASKTITIAGSSGGGATGGGSDQVFNENSTTITTSYTLSTGKSAMSVGPITINNGATVTVPSTARWVVL